MQLALLFWKKDTGNYMNHSKGLTQEQLNMLKELKVGDRLIIYSNTKSTETTPDLTMKVYVKKDVNNNQV